MADQMTVQFDGKTYALEDFELGELEWLEEEMGVPLDQIPMGSMKAAVRFVTVLKRRDNPEFSIDDARKLKLNVFNEPEPEPNGDGPKRPTKAARA